MIFKSVAILIILLLIFEISLRVLPQNWDTSQNDKSANLIGAQNFVYNFASKDLSKDTVIVGSSISRKLIVDSLSKNFINLAFNGWGAFDGLDLMKRANVFPSCILIESNGLREVFTQEEIINIFNPIVNYHPYIKSFQLQNQPVGILIGFLKEKMKAKILASKKIKRSNISLYNRSIEMNKKTYEHLLDDSISVRRLNSIKKLVDDFEEKNVKIIFFEVPIDTALINTNYINSARAYYNKYFPTSHYKHIPVPLNNFIYSDGIHLVPESAIEYTKFLKASLIDAKLK